MKDIAIRVEAVAEHGMATIWDADVLIWAASQIVEARDAGLRTSRLMAARPREILTFTGRGTSARDYHRLKAALDRLQSTTVATSLRQISERRMHRFSWINEWTERADAHGNADGIDLIMPDWFYRAVLDDALVLTIDRGYFALTGGVERWLYRVVRKHAGHQSPDGGSNSATFTPNRRAFRPSSGSLSSCVTSSAGSPSGLQAADRARRRRARIAGIFAPAKYPPTAVDNMWIHTCYREPTGTCHQEPAARAIRNRNRQILQAKSTTSGAPNSESNAFMNLTLLKLAAAGTRKRSGRCVMIGARTPWRHAHPHRIDLA